MNWIDVTLPFNYKEEEEITIKTFTDIKELFTKKISKEGKNFIKRLLKKFLW